MRLTCKRVLSWWYFACCLTQMACEYLSMEVMEQWITSESWALTSINIKWGFLRRFWGSLCTRHPASGCINTNDTFQWCLVLFRFCCWLEQKSLDVFEKKVAPIVLVPVGFLLCHTSLNTNQASQELWKMALRSGFYLTLTRDEFLNIHKVSEDLFDTIKGSEIRTTQHFCIAKQFALR